MTDNIDQTPQPTVAEKGRKIIERIEALDELPLVSRFTEMGKIKADAILWAVEFADLVEAIEPRFAALEAQHAKP